MEFKGSEMSRSVIMKYDVDYVHTQSTS